MLRVKRLEELEADSITAWRTAWEQNALTFERRLGGISIDTRELMRRLETARPELSDDAVDRECAAFLARIGVSTLDAFAEWFSSYEIPDLDAARPALSMWPSDVPEPPEELPGEWDRVLPYAASEDAVERLSAQVYLFILAAARATREEHAVTLSDSRIEQLKDFAE